MTTGIRERWLQDMLTELRPFITEKTGLEVPAVQLSVGYRPGARPEQWQTVYGPCSAEPDTAIDGTPNIYVTPELDKSTLVACELMHQICHMITGKATHNGSFAALGLQVREVPSAVEGRELVATADGEAGAALFDEINTARQFIGDYPHIATSYGYSSPQGDPTDPAAEPAPAQPKTGGRESSYKATCPVCDEIVGRCSREKAVALAHWCDQEGCFVFATVKDKRGCTLVHSSVLSERRIEIEVYNAAH